MADTIREKIIQDVVASMTGATYTLLNGADIMRGRVLFQEEIESLPIITIIPREEEAEIGSYGQTVCFMPVKIGALAVIGALNPSELGEAIHGELITAAMRIETGHARKMAYIGGGVEQYPDQLGQPVIAVSVNVAFEYETDIGDPYNLTT